jgi:tRNA U55 pseudouridine synthase TruB
MFALTNVAMFLHDRKMRKIVRRARKIADEQIARADKRMEEQTVDNEKHEVTGTYISTLSRGAGLYNHE